MSGQYRRQLPKYTSKPGAGELMCCGGVKDYDKKAMEGDPMIYIVIMLFVFSAGIASLMIIYMKKEQRDQEDANLYKIYVEAARDRYSEYLNRGRSVNKLALQLMYWCTRPELTERESDLRKPIIRQIVSFKQNPGFNWTYCFKLLR